MRFHKGLRARQPLIGGSVNSIISSVKQRQSQDKRKTHKWGIRVPASVKEALAMDATNKNTLWADAIAKEMKNVRVAFNILPDGEDPPPGYQFVRCHMIFDVKMEDFRGWTHDKCAPNYHVCKRD